MAEKKFDNKFQPPNIGDLAQRGGLSRKSPDAVPYVLGVHKGQLFIAESGNATAMVSHFSIGRLATLLEDARRFCVKYEESNAGVVARKYPMFGFMGRRWIASQIIEKQSATDSRQIVQEVYKEIEKQAPELRKWPPPECDSRPYEVKQGEIVSGYYEELKKMRQASRPKPLSEEDLQKRFPDFEIWTAMDKMKSSLRCALFNLHTGSIGKADAGQLFECIGSIRGVAESTASGWWKKYNDFSGKKRLRRKSL